MKPAQFTEPTTAALMTTTLKSYMAGTASGIRY
jgi:hypothetical protein